MRVMQSKFTKNERQTKFKWGRGCWVVGVLVGPGSAFVIFSFQSIYIGYTSYIVGLLVVYEQITNAWSGEKEK